VRTSKAAKEGTRLRITFAPLGREAPTGDFTGPDSLRVRIGELLGPDILEIVRDDPAALREGLAEFHPADVADLLAAIPR
jgi:hypothetical protein